VAASSVETISGMLKGRGIIDTACTGHYFQKSVIRAGKLKNIRKTRDTQQVNLPNGSTMKSTHQAQLNINALPKEAGTVHLFPDSELVIGSLVSVPTLCDANLTATFTKSKCYVTSNVPDEAPSGNVIIEEERSPTTGLWTILTTSHRKTMPTLLLQ